MGKLTLVTLAGSERVSKRDTVGQQLEEAQSINKSVPAIGDVISSLTSGGTRIPYQSHSLVCVSDDQVHMRGCSCGVRMDESTDASYGAKEGVICDRGRGYGIHCGRH